MADHDYYMRMCASCALHIHGANPPSYDYAINRTRRILYLTGAHESGGWQYRRQHRFSRNRRNGAFGLWQQEFGSIRAGVEMFYRNDELMRNAEIWLELWRSPVFDLPNVSVDDILLELQEPSGDALSCLLARLHYYRVPETFPDSLDGLAHYAKQHYNTHLGSATPEMYRDAYREA